MPAECCPAPRPGPPRRRGPAVGGRRGRAGAAGEAGGAPAGEARFYEALSAAGYAAASEADVLATEPALREVRLVCAPPGRCQCLGKAQGALG